MRQINLLPAEFKPGRKVSQAVKKFEKFFIIFLAIYLAAVGGSLVFSRYLENKYDDLTSRKQSLSAELKSLVEVETTTVYIRDRVNKYRSVPERDTEMKTLENFDLLYAILPPEALVKEIGINENVTEFGVSIPSTPVFIDFLDILTSSGFYNDALLSSLSFNQEKGYQFHLSLMQ